MCLGLGTTLQVLLGSDGRGGDPLALDRVQMAALVTTAAKFGAACETVERFREFDVAQRAIAMTDADGDGLLELGDLVKALPEATGQEWSRGRIQYLLERFDETGDGKLGLGEFTNLLSYLERGGPVREELAELWSRLEKLQQQQLQQPQPQQQQQAPVFDDAEATRDSSEDPAMGAWLNKLDAPQWGAASHSASSASHSAAEATRDSSEDAAVVKKLDDKCSLPGEPEEVIAQPATFQSLGSRQPQPPAPVAALNLKLP